MRRRMKFTVLAVALLAMVGLATAALAAEPDWFTRVKEQGLEAACRVEVERHGKGVLRDSLHVGRCYYNLGRWEEGVAVFGRLRRSPDENYAAAATARVGEGFFHLGRKEEAKTTFLLCLEEHPEAWLDGSVPELCRAWLAKLEGKLVSPDRPKKNAKKPDDAKMEEVKKEIDDLSKRLRELRELLEELKRKE
ncbi:MAG: tetratricopeptide repeat protein [Planctomycetota bacterium]